MILVLWIVSLPQVFYFSTVLYTATVYECPNTAHWYCLQIVQDMAFPTLLTHLLAIHLLIVIIAGKIISYFLQEEPSENIE